MPPKMRLLQKNVRYKFAYGGRGSGKSESFAKMFLYMGNKKKLKFVCAREYQNSIAESVHSLLVDIIEELDYVNYKVVKNEIVNVATKSKFIFLGLQQQDKKQTVKSLANADICWIEEAQSVSKGSLEILDPTIRKDGSQMWFSFNRLFPNDPIWDFMRSIPDNEKIEVLANYYDNPFLPKTLKTQAARSKREYDDKLNDSYLHTWLGGPIGFSEKTLFKLRDIEDSINRDVDDIGQIEVGVDVARFGKDQTVIAIRKGLVLTSIKHYARTRIDETVQFVIDAVDGDKSILIKVDDTGLGGGVTDFLLKYGYNVIGVNNGSKAKDSDKYTNAISEMWFELKNKIGQIKLLDSKDLTGELVSREWTIDTRGRRMIEAKDKYKKRSGKSPDFADATLLCFYELDNQEMVVLNVMP